MLDCLWIHYPLTVTLLCLPVLGASLVQTCLSDSCSALTVSVVGFSVRLTEHERFGGRRGHSRVSRIQPSVYEERSVQKSSSRLQYWSWTLRQRVRACLCCKLMSKMILLLCLWEQLRWAALTDTAELQWGCSTSVCFPAEKLVWPENIKLTEKHMIEFFCLYLYAAQHLWGFFDWTDNGEMGRRALHLCIRRSQLRWHVPPGGDPGHAPESMSLGWPGNTSVFPRKS